MRREMAGYSRLAIGEDQLMSGEHPRHILKNLQGENQGQSILRKKTARFVIERIRGRTEITARAWAVAAYQPWRGNDHRYRDFRDRGQGRAAHWPLAHSVFCRSWNRMRAGGSLLRRVCLDGSSCWLCIHLCLCDSGRVASMDHRLGFNTRRGTPDLTSLSLSYAISAEMIMNFRLCDQPSSSSVVIL